MATSQNWTTSSNSTKWSSSVGNRVSASRSIRTDWTAIAPANIVKLVDICADGLGTSKEAFFFPFLSASAAMLGRNACIGLNDLWPEPPVIWTAIIGDDLCRKKSAVQRAIIGAIREVEQHNKSQQAQQLFNDPDVIGQSFTTMLMSDMEFDCDKVVERMREGNWDCFLMSKDLWRIYNTLDQGLHHPENQGSASTKSKSHEAFFDLHSGQYPWTDDSDNYFNNARFNMTGYIHPQQAFTMIDNPAFFSGFLECNLAILCPKPRKVYHNQLIGANGPLIAPIFLKLRQDHSILKVYTLDEEADVAFASYYNDIEERLERIPIEERNLRRVLSKSQGQVARLALVLHCLNHVTHHIFEQQLTSPKTEMLDICPIKIPASIMYNSINLMRMCIRHKTTLLATNAPVPDHPESSRLALPHRQDVEIPDTSVGMNTGPRLVDVVSPSETFSCLQDQSVSVPSMSHVLLQQKALSIGGGNNLSVISGSSHRSSHPSTTSHLQENSCKTVPALSQSVHVSRQPEIPVNVSVAGDGPQIIKVSYTPQGLTNPVCASTHISTHKEKTVQKYKKPPTVLLHRPASGRHLTKNISLQRVNMTPSLAMPQRPLSRSPNVAKSAIRRAVKRNQSQAFLFTNKYPTSKDYENFAEKCPKKARKILTMGKCLLESCYVAQRKLAPPLSLSDSTGSVKPQNKYPTHAARAFLTALAEAGLGEMVSRTGSRSGKSAFRKYKYNNLSPSAMNILLTLNITEEEFMFVDRAIEFNM